MEDIIISIEDVTVSYGYAKPVLDRLNFKLRKGEKVGLIGPNGSGKTTFLQSIMGLLPISSGTIRLFGQVVKTEQDFRNIRRKIGFLFQNADDQLFSPTVIEDVAFGPLNMGKTPAEARQMSNRILKELNLEGFGNRVTYKLSGGEKKLIALATVLVMEPCVLLLDEPTTELDTHTRQRIASILNNLDTGYIIVSHEYDFLAETTRLLYSMDEGRIVYNGDTTILHTHRHIHPLGKIPHEHIKMINDEKNDE